MVKVYNNENTLIAEVSGELDDSKAAVVREKTDNAMMKYAVRHLVFDFSNLEFLDSSGIGVIIGRYKHIQKLNGHVAIVGLNRQMEKIIHLSGLLKIIDTYSTVDEAICALSSKESNNEVQGG